MRVLILSSPVDGHAKAVHDRLKKLNADVDFFRIDELDERLGNTLTIKFPIGSMRLAGAKGVIDFDKYDSIWHRRPGTVSVKQFAAPWVSDMVRAELRATIDGMFQSINTLWMNYPSNDGMCRLKLWQLKLAASLGFTIPDTIVTNDPEQAREFYESAKGEVIYKLLGETSGAFIPRNERPSGVTTLPVRPLDVQFLEQVKHSTHFFQKCIEKQFDVRVTVVGHTFYTVLIHSQSGKGKIDWRNDYTVPMEQIEIPDSIRTMCTTLMRKLRLNYGAIDFILTKENEWIFLEINSGGQYLWVEDRIKKMDITGSVARLLVGMDPPLIKRGCEQDHLLPQNF